MRSVRDALASVDGIDESTIKPNRGQRRVTFHAKEGLDLDSALAAHADNRHLKGWSVAEN